VIVIRDDKELLVNISRVTSYRYLEALRSIEVFEIGYNFQFDGVYAKHGIG